jgi:hypothetical protein
MMSRGKIWRDLLSKSAYEPVSDEEAVTMLNEGIHTGLRKGSEAQSSGPLWQAISKSDDGAWSDALNYCVWDLGRMGYAICKKVEK